MRRYRMPAEWEPHRATWISWPHHEPDWPGKLGPIPWVYAEIARVIAEHETVEILCASDDIRAAAREVLDAHAVRRDRVRLHIVPTDRVWLRDSAPTGVVDRHRRRSSCSNWAIQRLGEVRQLVAGRRGRRGHGGHHRRFAATSRFAPDGQGRIVLEGGGIEVNGNGLLLVTEEWLLTRRAGAQPRPHTTRLRTAVRRVARHPPHDLARRGLRRRRHARAHRRHRAIREPRHDRAGRRARPERRQSRAVDGQPPPPQARRAHRLASVRCASSRCRSRGR